MATQTKAKPKKPRPIEPIEVPPEQPLGWYTVAELAEMMKIDRKTVINLVSRGQFPEPVKVGCSNRWRASDYQAWYNGEFKPTKARG